MLTEVSREIHSKVLMFGEYSVLYNSQAVAVPFKSFSGKLKLNHERKNENSLLGLYKYLKERPTSLDLDRLRGDLEKGLVFESNIPYGQGLGSSAALTAGLFQKYSSLKESTNLNLIKKELGIIESFFHGKSSGFDPLVCFVGRPIVVNQEGKIEICSNDLKESNYRIFLVPTHEKRNGKEVINRILKKLSRPNFKNEFIKDYVSKNDQCVKSFLENRIDFEQNLSELSKLQYVVFKEVIADQVKDIWTEGLTSDQYYMKLCGAGGGGYYLAFSFDDSFIAPDSWHLLKGRE